MRERLLACGRSVRRELFEADARGLAIFRIAFGLALLTYLVSRTTGDSFVAFHTDLGVLPREHLLRVRYEQDSWGLFFSAGSPLGVATLFIVCGAAMASFTLGYRTRMSALATFFALVSLDQRNPHTVNAALNIAHSVMLYAIALPLGRHYSIDAWLRGRRGDSSAATPDVRVRSLGVFAFRLQLFYIYFLNVVQKDGATWRDGTAIHYVLRDDRITRPLTVWLRDRLPATVISAATFGTLALEATIAFCLLSPIVPRVTRRIAVGAIVALHLGIAVFIRIGPFPVILPSAALLVAASGDWTKFDAWISPWIRRIRDRFEAALALSRREPTPPDPWRFARLGPAMREGYFVLLIVAIGMLVRREGAWFEDRIGGYAPPPALVSLERILMIPQGFGMFGPNPPNETWVMVVDMELEDGRHVDPFRHARPRFTFDGHHGFGTDFLWQDYESRLIELSAADPGLVANLLDYLCRIPVLERWPGTHRIHSIEVYFVRADIALPGEHAPTRMRRELLGRRVAAAPAPPPEP